MQAYQETLMSGVKRDAESLSGFGQITHHDTLSRLVLKRTVVGDTDNTKNAGENILEGYLTELIACKFPQTSTPWCILLLEASIMTLQRHNNQDYGVKLLWNEYVLKPLFFPLLLQLTMNTREFVSPPIYGNLKNPGTKTWEKLSHVKTTVTTRRDPNHTRHGT